MKKWIAIILALLMLTLGGCSAIIPGQNGGEPTIPFDPENPPEINFDAPALSVTVGIRSELELTLSFCNAVLEVKALNTDGEALLAGLDLEGKVYHVAMTAVLEQAKDLGFLNDESTVSISVQERMEDIWTIACRNILTRPFDAFGEKAGITLKCELTPAGESAWEVTKTHKNQLDNRDEVICYNVSNQQILNRYTYHNGDYEERYINLGGHAYWASDGKFTYYGNRDGVRFEYTLYPDGTRSTTTSVSDGNGNYIWCLRVLQDGSVSEAFYKDGKIVRSIYVFPDGLSWEHIYENGEPVRVIITDADGNVTEEEVNQNGVGSTVRPPVQTAPNQSVLPETVPEDGREHEVTYYKNGNIESDKTTWPNGDYTHLTYREDGTRSSSVEEIEGFYKEIHYNEIEIIVSSCERYPNGDYTQLTYREDGTRSSSVEETENFYRETHYNEKEAIVSSYERYPNGDYEERTYHDNEQTAVLTAQSEGRYIELRYDEAGELLSEYQLKPDGSERRSTYENGVIVNAFEKEANGNDRNSTYYPDGSLEYSISHQNGTYSEDYWYQNGKLKSSYTQEPDGFRLKMEFDENGNMTLYEETCADGAYRLDVKENGKYVLSKGYGSNGLYWENVYDKNGKLIKTIREVSPGEFMEDNVEGIE